MKHVEFRKAAAEDVVYVADHIRRGDALEAEATGITDLKMALEASRRCSDYTWVALVEGVPVMVFGCGCPLLHDEGDVWAIGTDVCTKLPREMLFYGRQKIREMLDIYPRLGNYCDARYRASHRWLRKLGFKVLPPVPCGPKGAPFCKVFISREDI